MMMSSPHSLFTLKCITVLLLLTTIGELLSPYPIVVNCYEMTTLTKNLLPTTPEYGPFCNDGTPAGYYYHPGPNNSTEQDSGMFVIYMQGGWWCHSDDDCDTRYKTTNDRMSSKTWPETIQRTGLLSNSPLDNPYFYKAHKVHVNYCSSDVFSGDYTAKTLNTRNGFYSKYHFHGLRIVKGIIQDLIKKRNLGQAKQVIFAGGSAGGVGVSVLVDRVREWLWFVEDVRGFSDSGWLATLDSYKPDGVNCTAKSERCPQPQSIAMGLDMWMATPNQNCMESVGQKSDQLWKCFYASYLLKNGHLTTPTLWFQYKFDSAMANMANADSTKDPGAVKYIERAIGQQVYDQMMMLPQHSFYLAACYSHTMILSDRWTKLTVNNVTIAQALYQWYNKQSGDFVTPVRYIEQCGTINCNTYCSEKH